MSERGSGGANEAFAFADLAIELIIHLHSFLWVRAHTPWGVHHQLAVHIGQLDHRCGQVVCALACVDHFCQQHEFVTGADRFMDRVEAQLSSSQLLRVILYAST